MLSLMNRERMERGTLTYRLPDGVADRDSSLFFGLSGIGYEFLRYFACAENAPCGSMPALLPVRLETL